MLQPFFAFRKEFVSRLIEMKQLYLVSQTYHRAPELTGQGKTVLLFTNYDSVTLAKTHLNAVRHDKYAAIIQLEKAEHRQKVNEMLSDGSKYAVFWAVIKSAEELQLRLDRQYKDNMRRYIEKHTDWRIGRDTIFRPNLELTFGELFIILKWNSRRLRIKFEDIETA
ncbi:MAG TPA: hypothetical protein VGD17_15995 [Chitinophagaceae bacterium]